MTRSLNEMELLIRKAGVGAGLDFGLAEDAGRAAIALCRRGLDGACVIADALADLADGRRGHAGLQQRVALVDGPSLLDELVECGQGSEVYAEAVDHPVALVGLALVSASDFQIGVGLRIGDIAIAVPHDQMSTDTIMLNVERQVSLRHLGGLRPDVFPAVLPIRPVVNAQVWAKLEKLAARTYVPSSTASRLHGAGAGLVDND